MNDPFATLTDEAPADGPATRARLLNDARRGFVPLRKALVQRPRGEASRAAALAALVTARQERPLDALLLLHALEPILEGTPLPLAIWAKMLSRGNTPCTAHVASQAFNALVERRLITRQNLGRRIEVWPLLEDGTNARPWTRPGRDDERGKGYFTIPYAYWTEGLVDQLHLAGKAMLLILLAETTQTPTFAMAVERAPQWYGISERTAERGYRQLEGAGVLRQHRQIVAEPRSPTGVRAVWHRALADPYSTDARAQLQKAARRAYTLPRPSAGGSPGSPSTEGSSPPTGPANPFATQSERSLVAAVDAS